MFAVHNTVEMRVSDRLLRVHVSRVSGEGGNACTSLDRWESRREALDGYNLQDFLGAAGSICLLAVVTNISLFFLFLSGSIYWAKSPFPIQLSEKY